MERLSEKHRELLRSLVKAVRDGDIDEEFTVIWAMQGGMISGKGGFVQIPAMSSLGLDLLADEGFLYQRVSYESRGSEFGGSVRHTQTESHRECYITPDGYRAVDSDFNPTPDVIVARPPVEITESLARFRQDFPDPNRLAFVMMQFGSTTAHSKILTGIRNALEPHGMTALRADDKEYHDDLYFNILTYIYGARFGIAVFERIQEENFNPNVSLEVGYMLGLRKSVCFLKDKTLRTLHTDLVGKLYRAFDPLDPESSIPNELFTWMDQKGFILRAKA
jgi:hypothetical protein